MTARWKAAFCRQRCPVIFQRTAGPLCPHLTPAKRARHKNASGSESATDGVSRNVPHWTDPSKNSRNASKNVCKSKPAHLTSRCGCRREWLRLASPGARPRPPAWPPRRGLGHRGCPGGWRLDGGGSPVVAALLLLVVGSRCLRARRTPRGVLGRLWRIEGGGGSEVIRLGRTRPGLFWGVEKQHSHLAPSPGKQTTNQVREAALGR